MKATYGQYIVPAPEVMVNFGIGQPSNDELPLDIIKLSCTKMLEIDDKSVLQYGDIPGYQKFRQELSNFLSKRYDESVHSDELFITNGVTGAISLICSLYKNKIKKIYVEEPTYFLMINIFKEFGFEVETVSLEDDGINTIELEKLLDKDKNETKMLYTIPAFHNPTSIKMSHEKRLKISELSNKYNMIILADEVYQLLYFDELDKPPKPLYYYGGLTYSISSFSKILAPSLRLGWIQSSQKLLKILKDCGQLDSSGGVNPFVSRIVHNILEDGNMDKYLDDTKNRLSKRCDMLSENLSEFCFIKPNGGYFIWIKLPFDSIKFLQYCLGKKVKFHTGEKFSSNGQMRNFIRLSFSFYDYKGLRTGGNRLSECFKYYQNNYYKTNVSILGHAGKLGSKLVQCLENHNEYNVFNKIGRTLHFNLSGFNDVIVDVSSAESLKNLLIYLIFKNYRVPLLIGTTGNLPNQLIKEYSRNAPVAVISNFSYGIPFLQKVFRNCDMKNWKIAIEEIHHVHKKDKPSATAKSLADSLNYYGEITSIRKGEDFGTHKIKIESDNEVMEFYHKAKSRNIFASGCLRFIDWIKYQKNGVYYGMEYKELDFS